MNKQKSSNLRELIRILVRNLGNLEKSDASYCGVTIAQCHAIVEIGRARQISLTDLADLLGLDKSTMSRTINHLVEADLAIREHDSENRRCVNIELAEKGIDVFENIEKSMQEYYKSILSLIPEDKREQLAESLELLTVAVKK